MSYRAFKRLLGETSLERKCRFLFGAATLLLISLSFWIYANRTEHLAYDQTTTTCRVLLTPILERHHVEKKLIPEMERQLARAQESGPGEQEKPQKLKQLDDSMRQWGQLVEARKLQDNLMGERAVPYPYWMIRERQGDDSYERELFNQFGRTD